MSKKILFNTWAGAFFNPGGGEVQLLNTRSSLQDLGYEIGLFDPWRPQRDIDLLHQFSVQSGANHVVTEYKNVGKKVALSPILWADFPKDSFTYHQIRDLMVQADILFTNSDAESEKISRGFEIPFDKFHKTRNSITSDYSTLGEPAVFRKTYGVEGDFVLSVANIDRRKNTKVLMQACDELGLKLVLIGAIRDPAYFAEFKDAFHNYVHLGPIPETSMLKSACRAARVFALPSLCETPGISALEAASQGARVVITSEGAAEEYFGEHAIYVDPLDFAAVKAGIREGFETKIRDSQIGFIKDNYAWAKTAAEIARGYEKVLK